MWKVEEVPSLKDKIIVVTGGNSGIGYEAVKVFAKKEATLVIASSNKEKSDRAVQTIKDEIGHEKIEAYALNLGSLTSIKTFAETLKKAYKRIDILINNSGVMYKPYEKTEDGFESQMGINHLGHFYLTSLLMPLIKKSERGRIVNISSIAHKFAKVNLNDYFFDNEVSFSPSKGYNRSKLTNLLFTIALKHKCEKQSIPVDVYAAHPGIADTSLTKEMKQDFRYKMIKKISHSAYGGGLPTVMAATTTKYPSGTYFGPKGFMEIKGRPGVAKKSKHAKDLDLALTIWDLSEQALNTSFDLT